MAKRSGVVTVVFVSVCLAMIGLMTVGLPGAVILEAANFLAGLVSSAQLGGDQAWPATLAITALGPFALVPAHFVLRRAHLARWPNIVLTTVLALAVTLAVSAAAIILSGR